MFQLSPLNGPYRLQMVAKHVLAPDLTSQPFQSGESDIHQQWPKRMSTLHSMTKNRHNNHWNKESTSLDPIQPIVYGLNQQNLT